MNEILILSRGSWTQMTTTTLYSILQRSCDFVKGYFIKTGNHDLSIIHIPEVFIKYLKKNYILHHIQT